MNVIDILADEVQSILDGLYRDPFIIHMNQTSSGFRGDVKFDTNNVDITCAKKWINSDPEPTSNRLCRIIVSYQHVQVGRLRLMKIPLSDPKLLEKLLVHTHDEITRYILDQARVMDNNQNLCRTTILDPLINKCREAVTLIDLRYLAHMYSAKYLGWESIPDCIVVGIDRDDGGPAVDRRPYRKEQVLHEMHDPSRWQGD